MTYDVFGGKLKTLHNAGGLLIGNGVFVVQQGREVADTATESYGSRSRSNQRSQGKGTEVYSFL